MLGSPRPVSESVNRVKKARLMKLKGYSLRVLQPPLRIFIVFGGNCKSPDSPPKSPTGELVRR